MIPQPLKRPDIEQFNFLLDKCIEYSYNMLEGDWPEFLPTMMLYEWAAPAEAMDGLPGMRLIVSCFQNFSREMAGSQCYTLGVIMGQRSTQLAACFLCAPGKIEVTKQVRDLVFAGDEDAPNLAECVLVQGITADKWTNGAMIHTFMEDGRRAPGEIMSDPYGPERSPHMEESNHYLEHFLRGFAEGMARASARDN